MLKTKHFLIIFDGAVGAMREDVREFADVAEALSAYVDAERRFGEGQRVQVVLVAADSIETVQATHPNFWGSTDFQELTRIVDR